MKVTEICVAFSFLGRVAAAARRFLYIIVAERDLQNR